MTISLVHDAALAEPDPEPGPGECWAHPTFWLPNGERHAASTLGIRYDCPRCKVSGPPVFGQMFHVSKIALDAFSAFPHSDDCPWG